MDRYLDLRILPDPELPTFQLMSALFARLHRRLAGLDSNDIGISFPEVNEEAPELGGLLRLHGGDNALSKVLMDSWLAGTREYIQMSDVGLVPREVQYRRVKRVQVKSSPERIRRRQMRRHGWTEEEAHRKIADSVGGMLTLPYVSLFSASTGQRFHLFIKHESADVATPGEFNAYGLSSTATIPWF